MKIYYTIDTKRRVYPACDWQEDIVPDYNWRVGDIEGTAYEEHGVPKYKDVDGVITPRTTEEIQEDIDSL